MVYILFAIIIVINIWSMYYIMNVIEETPYAIKAQDRITIQKYKDFESYETIPDTKHPVIMPKYKKGMAFKNGAVSTAGEACLIAEAIWYAQYGYEYYKYKIKNATLINNDFWLVKAQCGVRVLTIEIRKSDGKILRNFFAR